MTPINELWTKKKTTYYVSGAALRSAREAAGLRPSEFARMIRVSPQQLSDMERRNKSCTERTARAINAALKRPARPEEPCDSSSKAEPDASSFADAG